MSKLNSLLLLMISLLPGCKNDSEVAPSPVYLVSATPVSEVSLETLQLLAYGFQQKEVADKLKYGVKTYRVVYNTNYKGQRIKASGLIYVPQGLTGKAPLISLHHGTTFEKDQAPSASGEFSGMELFASAGFIALMPDFIGYGESSSVFHPYYDKQHSASDVIDMIHSSKEFLNKEGILFNDQLFLAGYSEGGYVTLAAAKEIEQNPEHDLTITAVAAGAGGYDLTEMLKGVTTNPTYAYPSYLAFVLMSYNTTYDWNKPLDYFFKKQYADALNAYMNGNYSGGFINSKLTTNVTSLLNTDFYNRIKQPDQESELKQALANNSVSGWKTAIPTRLYHGTKDEIIPYQNSELTLSNFKSAGSTDVTLMLIPGGTHGSSFVPMMQSFIPWFLSLKNS